MVSGAAPSAASPAAVASLVSSHGRNELHETQNWAPGSFRVPHCSQMFSAIRPSRAGTEPTVSRFEDLLAGSDPSAMSRTPGQLA